MAHNGKLKLGLYWAASCGGCEIAVVELREKILLLDEAAEILFWPVAMDFKVKNVEAMPDGHMDVCLFNGAIRTSENEDMAHLLRRKSKVLVAFGSCAYYSVKADFSVWPDLRNTLLAGYVGL
jgi:F420-non-reducing hydrogenase small subunit